MTNPAIAAAVPLAFSVQTSDFDELAQGIPGWDAVFSQLSPGPFHGELDILKLPDVTFYRIAANREILARGAHLPGTFAFSVVTQRPVSSIWLGRPLGTDEVIFLRPNGALDHKTCTNYLAFFVEVNATAFLAGAQALTGRDVEADLAGKTLLSPSSETARRLQVGIRQTLNLARTDSLDSGVLRERLLHALLAQVAQVIVDSNLPNSSPGRFRNRQLLVQEAEGLMEARPDGGLTILNLCKELCVSERGLHYAFREMLGQTPMAFYRHQRLNAARRQLKKAAAIGTTVATTGRALGFWHTGQFAADYRRLFGELPSTTLADSKDFMPSSAQA